MKKAAGLILVDIQEGLKEVGYFGKERNNPNAEANAGKLLVIWRNNNWPVFHVQHCSEEPDSPLKSGQPGNKIQEIVAPKPGEPVIQKTVNSGFIGTNLQERLVREEIEAVVICGLTTDHCVSTTTRMAGNLGFSATLVHDATATFDKTGHTGEHFSAQLVHDTAIASLKDEFARIISTSDLLMELKQA